MDFIDAKGDTSLNPEEILHIFNSLAEHRTSASLLDSAENDGKFIKFMKKTCVEYYKKWTDLISKNFLKEKYIKILYEVYKS